MVVLYFFWVVMLVLDFPNEIDHWLIDSNRMVKIRMDRPKIRKFIFQLKNECFFKKNFKNTLLLEVLLVPNASKLAKLSEPNASLAVLLEPNGSPMFVVSKQAKLQKTKQTTKFEQTFEWIFAGKWIRIKFGFKLIIV